jgi:hypothetical protein
MNIIVEKKVNIFRGLYRGINEFKKVYQYRLKVVKNVADLVGSHNILNR